MSQLARVLIKKFTWFWLGETKCKYWRTEIWLDETIICLHYLSQLLVSARDLQVLRSQQQIGSQLAVLLDVAIVLLNNLAILTQKWPYWPQNYLVTLSVIVAVHFYFFRFFSRLRLWSRIFTSKNSNTNLLKNGQNYNCLDAEGISFQRLQDCRKWIELNCCLTNFLDFVFDFGTTE